MADGKSGGTRVEDNPTEVGEEFSGKSETKYIEVDINTDGRGKYDWQSRYKNEARREMKYEGIYVAVILAIALAGLFFHWKGSIGALLCIADNQMLAFNRIGYYFLSGLLGGSVFGIKYFYRAVARGYWSQDRRFWRIFSPWVSAVVAIVVGCMVVAGFIDSGKEPSDALNMCLGFFAGYFADKAVGKMSEVATALFGSSGKAE